MIDATLGSKCQSLGKWLPIAGSRLTLFWRGRESRRALYGGTDFLADQALEAIAQNQIDRHQQS